MRFILGLAIIAVTVTAVALGIAGFQHEVPQAAREVQMPELAGAPLLTVSGLDKQAYPNGEMAFDLPRLKALGETGFSTSTVWTDGMHEFKGISLKAMVDYLHVSSGTLQAAALNDYVVDIPVTDAVPEGPIMAFEMDGTALSVRDRGPLWVVYPYDHNGNYRSEVIYTRSIWQLTRIKVTR